jgi:hypothetical protein
MVQKIVNAIGPATKHALARWIDPLGKRTTCRRVPYF